MSGPLISEKRGMAALARYAKQSARGSRQLAVETSGIQWGALFQDPFIHHRIGQVPVYARVRHPEAHARVSQDFPVSKMLPAYDTGAARSHRLELFERLECDPVFRDDPRNVKKFGEGASQIVPHRQSDAPALDLGHLGVGEGEIAERAPVAFQPRGDQPPAPTRKRRRGLQRQSRDRRRHEP